MSILTSSQAIGAPKVEVAPDNAPSINMPGAVVIGGDYQGLGIVRSLGKRRIPVCVIDNEYSIAKHSRYTKHYVRVSELQNQRRAVEQILDVGRRLGLRGWVLFPTREETVAAFAQYREQLSQYFRVPTPMWSTVRWAWDKRETYKLANELGIPIPSTWYVQSRAELSGLPLRFPVAIKPAIKEHFVYATRAKAWRADNWDQLVTLYNKAAACIGDGEVMIQDLIPGDGRHQFAYCAFFKDGRPVGKLTARRMRQHPAEFGRASTYVKTVEVPELEVLSEKFLRAIDYYGLVELEYKRDPRDGQFRLLDVNARTWGYHTIGAASGVDFPYLLFADQTGLPVENQQGKVGIRWLRITTDLPVAVVEILRGRLDFHDYIRSLRKTHTEAVFCREDPMPGLVELGLIPYLFFKRGF